MASILVITSEEALASDVKRSLEERGHRVAVAAQRADGTRLLGDVGPDATLLHAGVADGGGSDLLRIRRRSDGTLTVELADEGLNFESVERAVIVEAFRRCNGSPTQAARLLGMTRDTMRYRIEKFGIAANES